MHVTLAEREAVSNKREGVPDEQQLYAETVRAYDSMARDYGIDDGAESLDSELVEMFESRLSEQCTILDLGSGPGQYARHFASHGYRVVAVDNSLEMLRELCRRGRHQHVLPVLMDIRDLAFRAEFFDAIWASASLIHVLEKSLDDVLKKLKATLKPDGIMMANFAVSDAGLRYERTGEDSFKSEGRFFQHYGSEKEIVRILGAAGWTVVETSTREVRPPIGDGQVRGYIKWINLIVRPAN